jgi:hypothetical protein
MTKISKAAFKKAILAVETERLKHASAFGAHRSELGALRKNRRASEKILSEFLRNAGLDLNRLRALNKERSAELDRLIERHKADAIKLAARRRRVSYSNIAAKRELVRAAGGKSFLYSQSVTLDTPFITWSIPTISGVEPAVTPQGSSAKFKFSTSKYSGWQKVGFYFLWPSPYSDYAIIIADTSLAATGYIKADASWGLWGNTSSLTATGLLDLWLGWPDADQVTSSNFFQQPYGYVTALGTWLGGDTQGQSIDLQTELWTPAFAVPPGGLVVFEVAMELDYGVDDGDVEADFESGDFSIVCPGVVFDVLNNPPLA